MAYKIDVDKNKCIGCGNCAAICPKQFEVVECKATAKKKEVEKISCEQKAAESCPVQAISVKKK